jgi:hypothetical protein
MYSTADPDILEWSASENRILLTHDKRTIPKYAYERVNAGKKMVGVFMVARRGNTDKVIDDLVVLIECSLDGEWENQVVFVPMR